MNRTFFAMALLGFTAASSNAFADFNGTWVGAQAKASGAVNAACGKAQFNIVQTSSTLSVTSEAFACGGFSMATHTYTFDISGNDLGYQGQTVGQIDDSSFSYNLTGQGASDSVSFTLNGAVLDYQEDIGINTLSEEITSSLVK